MSRRLTQAEKKLTDQSMEVLKPIEHEEKLQDLLKQQAEIYNALDLNKSESGAAAMDNGEEIKGAV